MRIALIAAALAVLAQKEPSTTKEAMKPVNFLVGEWRTTITAEDGKGQGWEEMQAWEYRIEKDDFGMQFTVKDGKKFKEGVLTYDLKRKIYRLEMGTIEGKKVAFEGKLAGKELSMEQVVEDKGAAQDRMAFTFLRDNRFLSSYDRREAGSKTWLTTLAYQYTKQGVPFVKSDAPKCVVTGGTGTIEVSYQGKSYYVC
jgi:hypothetical protein